MTKKVFLTLDTDWVEDWILEDSLEIFTKKNLKATIFATNHSNFLNGLNKNNFEISLHPNFNFQSGKYNQNAISDLKKIYPNSVGMRSHTLLFGSTLIPELEKANILYESNIFLYMHEKLKQVQRSKNLTSIPFNWSDDKHLELEKEFSLDELPSLKQKGLNVFNFHPIHIFLNTDKYERYQEAKKYFNKPKISKFINKSSGIATLLDKLTDHIQNTGIQTGLLKELIL